MKDITVIKEGKGSYSCVIECHRRLDLERYGKYKEVQHGFMWISDKVLKKLERDFYVSRED